uniref:exo-alpha-sialidase n=1 Tax=Neogobius melanostomus TaxID=47308 RepID=A0A8C6T185_9GOBI
MSVAISGSVNSEPNGVTYRVPALLYLSGSKTMLAFCEERLSPSDSQAHLLVMRKGTFYRNYVEWEDMHVLGTAFLPGHRSMNPCPVHDEFTGTVFLFFIAVLGHTSESQQLITGKNVTRLCFVSSLDNGDTWSPVTDLTQTVIGETIKEWATFALGPGHGIQLKSGRLMIPAYTTPRAFCFHSDTHGRTWRFGEAVPGPESVECQVVSVDEEDGTNILYCNARSPLGYRVQALSLDDGAVFQEGQLVPRLVEPRNGCHGSIVGFPAPLHLLHSFSNHPSQHSRPLKHLYCHPTWNTARKDLGVFLSLFPRDPDSWRGPWVIYDGPSAYSDVAYLELSPSPGAPPAVAFACLFECGTNSAYDQICFSIFTLYELIDHLPHNVQQAATSKEESQTIRNYFDSSKTKPKKKRKGKVKVCTIL